MPDLTVHRVFDRVAHLYDKGWLQRLLYTAVQERVLDELRVAHPGSILDVGCGTGIFASRLEQELAPGGVVGCDLSAGMLTEAAARSRRVGWVRGDSARMPLRDGAFDAVVCTQAFHFFDHPAAWAEFHRVLAPGGLALVGMMNPRTGAGSRRMTQVFTKLSKTAVTTPTRPEMERLATEAGLEVIGQHAVDYTFRHAMPVVVTVARK